MAGSTGIQLSIRPFEVIFPASRVEIRSTSRIDPKYASGAVVVGNAHADVQLAKDGKTLRLPEGRTLGYGWHTIEIHELLDSEGKRLCESVKVPFFVTDSAARAPQRLSVEHMVRLRLEKLGTTRLPSDVRPKGPFVEIMKAVDRASGKAVEIAFDHDGKRVNHRDLLAGILKRRQKRFGNLQESLFSEMGRTPPNQQLPVAIWLKSPRASVFDKNPLEETVKPSDAEADYLARIEEARNAFIALAAKVLKGEEFIPDEIAPVVYSKLTPASIRKMSKLKQVVAIFRYEEKGEVDLTNSIAIANSDDVHTLGFDGTGVNVAVWEDGPDSTTDLVISAAFSTSPATSTHARLTHAIIRNNQSMSPHGHANAATLFSANTMALAALRWAVRTRGCTVVSQSFHRDAEQTSSGLSFDDMYKDWLVLFWPYPTILQAAGNGASTEFVNHKGYNSLAVGNHNDSAGAMAGDSVFRNPATTHRDRELPEIAANGTAVTSVGLTMSGTSFAAPATAGATALLQNVDRTLRSWPEGCRAILLAGANTNVTGGTWSQDRIAGVDASDGSGALDSLASVRIAQTRVGRNNAGVRRGWDVGRLRPSDLGAGGIANFVHTIAVPEGVTNPRVKVTLAWDSYAFALDLGFIQIGMSILNNDLDLLVEDSSGNRVATSASWDNSYEIAEFQARAGQTYRIRIRRWSGPADVWYGVAWSVYPQT
jgi:hypothetical protein